VTDLTNIFGLWLIGLGAVGGVVGLAAWRKPGSTGLQRVALACGQACLLLSVAAWAARWRAAGHLPLFGTYESSLSLAAAVMLAALVGQRRVGGVGLWPVACGVAAALVAHGALYDPTIYALTISERSWVVDIHAIVAWAAFGALTANAALALWILVATQGSPPTADASTDEAAGLRAGRISGSDPRPRWLAFTLSLGFFLHTAMLVSGSFYKFLLFGKAWSFDPIETLGFVAWVAYGTILHLHLFAGWEGRRLAVWCLSLFLLLVVSYRGIVYFPAWSTYHIFDMDLRIHVTGDEVIGGTP
jgi:ABC-type transport system involved in cytochrome c biogenesis permease subunit